MHLTYAVQWLIEELCSGWTIVDNLTGCLLLLKASAQLEHLVADVESILIDSKDGQFEHISVEVLDVGFY